MRYPSARTPLFRALQRAVHAAGLPEGEPSPAPLSRRTLLRGAAAGVLAAAGAEVLPPAEAAGVKPRIAIVGGGLAGLNAAYTLRKAGITAPIYEARERAGGRVRTARDLLAPGLTTELGAEFIDTSHTEVLSLARELGLSLIDTQARTEARLVREIFFFGGQHRSEADVIAAFRPLAARIRTDVKRVGEAVDFRTHSAAAVTLDRTSLREYLAQVEVEDWLRSLLEVAYVSEYGLDADQQSALNLLLLIGTTGDRFEMYGESDERYKIRGGNQRLPDALAARVQSQLRTEHRLEAVTARGKGFRLSFATPKGAREVDADFVILCLPFTLLRQVKLDMPLPAAKRRAIAELGYGTNTKVLAGFHHRVWREQGLSGALFSDQPFQTAWDNSRLQPGHAGGLTFYLGGRAGVDIGSGEAAEHVRRFLPEAETSFPGLQEAFNGHTARFHWPSYRWSLGSYSCYRPGQWTSLAGAEGMPVGNMLFAGEHTSMEFQGFMNGAADTGNQAARRILSRVRPRR